MVGQPFGRGVIGKEFTVSNGARRRVFFRLDSLPGQVRQNVPSGIGPRPTLTQENDGRRPVDEVTRRFDRNLYFLMLFIVFHFLLLGKILLIENIKTPGITLVGSMAVVLVSLVCSSTGVGLCYRRSRRHADFRVHHPQHVCGKEQDLIWNQGKGDDPNKPAKRSASSAGGPSRSDHTSLCCSPYVSAAPPLLEISYPPELYIESRASSYCRERERETKTVRTTLQFGWAKERGW